MSINLIAVLMCFAISLMLGPVIIKFCSMLKIKQNVSEYVTEHTAKQGTHTMGGLIFILPMLFLLFLIPKENADLAVICIVVMIGYGIIGFLDDYLKIKYKHNEGLKPYQKIIGQGLLSLIIAIYAYNSLHIGGRILIPFTVVEIYLGWWIIPVIMITFVATTNAVNLTDGLDGLAGSVSAIYSAVFAILILIFTVFIKQNGSAADTVMQYENLITVCAGLTGALLGYLWYNVHPAKIFMGDTGSLALGGIFACIAIFTKMQAYILFVGAMFVVSAISVIMQVLYYKRTKKRIFLMAPFHHHLQKKGWSENKVVNIYIIISMVMGALTLLGVYLVMI